LYTALSDAAKNTNSSLSDIMREAIVEKLDKLREAQARKFTTPHSTLLVSIRGSHIPDCPFPKEYLEIGRYKLLKGSCRSFKSRFIPSQSEMNMLWVEGE